MKMSLQIKFVILGLIIWFIITTIFIKYLFFSEPKIEDGAKVSPEINELFSKFDNRIIVYPKSRTINTKEGGQGEFAFRISNDFNTTKIFTYNITSEDIRCGNLTTSDAVKLSGKTSGNIVVNPESVLENPIMIEFDMPKDITTCVIAYNIEVDSGAKNYASKSLFIIIE